MDPELIKKRNEEFNEKFNSIPMDELLAREKEQHEQDEKDFQALKEGLARGLCSYCGYDVGHFSDKKSCFHWLLKPKGFKKKHFPLIYKIKSFHQLEAYLRWVANTVVPMRNINDLVEEGTSKKVIEETIRYKNLEWSFSCSQNDFKGHKDTHEGKFPHYHFQMKVDGMVIINYSGFHIPFDDYDFFSFDIKNGVFDKIKAQHIQGASMQTFFKTYSPEEIIDMVKNTSNEDEQDVHMQTLLMADEGTTISGDEIADLMKESRETGVSMAKLVKRLKNVTQTTFVSPGPSIPEIAERTPNRPRGKSGQDTSKVPKNPFPKTAVSTDFSIIDLCGKLVSGVQPFYLNVETNANAVMNDCYGNVEKIINEKGGTIQFGWQIWETLPEVMAEAEFHAIWKDEKGVYHDITPKPWSIKKILFLPDSNRKFEGKQIDNVRVPLKKDSLIEEYIACSVEFFKLSNEGELANQFGLVPMTPKMREIKQRQLNLEIEIFGKYFS